MLITVIMTSSGTLPESISRLELARNAPLYAMPLVRIRAGSIQSILMGMQLP
jgi:hypothetical protein